MTFKEIIESYGKTLSYSGTMKTQTEEIPLSEENIDTFNPHFDGALYTSVMRCLDIVLKGDYRKAEKGCLICDNSLTARKDGNEKTVNYGTYIVAEAPEYDDRECVTKLICYDYMYKTMQEYKLKVSYPVTLKDYLLLVAEACGITVANIDELKNVEKQIREEKYLNTSDDEGSTYFYRDVLDDIARCAGCSFTFKSDANGENVDELYIVYVTDGNGRMKAPVHTLEISNFKNLTITEKYGPANSVIFSRQPQEDNVYLMADGVNADTAVSVKLRQPLIAEGTDEERQRWLPEILNAVKGTEYQCYSLDSYGIGYLNFGDVFKIKAFARDGLTLDYSKPEEYLSVFMRTDMTVDGDIKETSRLEMPVATSTDYSAGATEREKRMLEAWMKVDKQLGEITSFVSDPEKGLATQVKQNAKNVEINAEELKKINEAGYITESAAKSFIEVETKNITAVVTESLKRANKNLFIDSECFGSATVSTFRSQILKDEITTDEVLPLRKVRQISFWGSGDILTNVGFTLSSEHILGQKAGEIDKLEKDKTYALSFKAKIKWADDIEKDLSLTNFLYVGSGITAERISNSGFALSSEWRDFNIVFKLSDNPADFQLRFFIEAAMSMAYTISFSSFMLVESDTPVEWVPDAEAIDQSVEAKLSLYVKTDTDGNLVSAIHAKANQITIESDNFTLDGEGNMTCNNANITGGKLFSGAEDTHVLIEDGQIKQVFGEEQILKIGVETSVLIPTSTGYTSVAYTELVYKNGIRFNNNQGGIIDISRQSWGYGDKISEFERDMIKSSGGLVVSANGSANALILAGSSVWLCGKLYFTNYRYHHQDKMPLYVNTDGEITT